MTGNTGASAGRATALVTGASSGIGRECARLLAAMGQDLIIVGRSRERLATLRMELEQAYGGSVRLLVRDLSAPAAADSLFEEIHGESARIGVLVNNAGVGYYGDFAETDWEREEAMVRLNVVTPTRLTKLMLRGMLERGAGRILMVASTAGLKPGPRNAVYAATKAYLIAFSEAINCEVSGSGVTVTVLCPGFTDTGFATAASMGRDRIRWKKAASPESVARSGIEAMLAGKRLVIPGFANNVLAVVLPRLPRGLLLRIMDYVRHRERK